MRCIGEQTGMPRPCSTVRDLRGANPALPGPGSAAGVSRQRQTAASAGQAEQAANGPTGSTLCRAAAVCSRADMPSTSSSGSCGLPVIQAARVQTGLLPRPSIPPSIESSGQFPGFAFHRISFSAVSAVSAASRVLPHALGCIYRLDRLGWWHASPGK